MVHPPVIAAVTAAILLLIQIGLMLSVDVARRRHRQSLGDGGNPAVLQAVRRHGNFAENAAIFLIGLALLEMLGGQQATLEFLVSVFILGRISHAIGLSLEKTVNWFRIAGVIATVSADVTLAARLIQAGWPFIHF